MPGRPGKTDFKNCQMYCEVRKALQNLQAVKKKVSPA
jgi:hypothetical protein